MFTQSCYLLDCNEYVCKILNDMGYHLSKHSNGSECIATTACLGSYAKLSKDTLLNPNPRISWNSPWRINCGKNMFLFLALAGLNNERTAHQYHVSDNGIWYLVGGESNTHEDLEDFINLECDIPNSGIHWHKANVEEILNHFKK